MTIAFSTALAIDSHEKPALQAGHDIRPSYSPRYVQMEEFLGEFRRECELARVAVKNDWQRYRLEKEAVEKFSKETLPTLKAEGRLLDELIAEEAARMHPDLRFKLIQEKAEKIVSALINFKNKCPGCVYNIRLDIIIDNLSNIIGHSQHRRIATDHFHGSFEKYVDQVVKKPQEPLDDPAMGYVPQNVKEAKTRKELIWQADGMYALTAKFISVFTHVCNRNKIDPVVIQGKEYWAVHDLCTVMDQHCIKDEAHPFNVALKQTRQNCGTKLAVLQLAMGTPRQP